jgi:hypothetical protein
MKELKICTGNFVKMRFGGKARKVNEYSVHILYELVCTTKQLYITFLST